MPPLPEIVVTPRLTTGGPTTRIDVADTVANSQAAALRNAGQASALLAQSNQALIERGRRLVGEAAQAFANIDATAVETRRKSQAQDVLADATLKADEEIQQLLNTGGIEPLELAQRSEVILDRVANEAVGRAASLGGDAQEFVRGKMTSLKVQRVPGVRREGFKRESEVRLASLDRRMFLRKRELFRSDTTDERRVELLTENMEDIQAHAGVHISTDKAQDMLQREVKDFEKNVWFELLAADPMAAMKMIPDLQLAPGEEIQLNAQAQNILQAEDNRRRQAERDLERETKKRGEEMETLLTGRIALEGADPSILLQDPQVRGTLTGSQQRTLFNFHRSLQKASDEDTPTKLNEFLSLKVQGSGGAIPPHEMAEEIRRTMDTGVKFTRSEVSSLMNESTAAWKSEQEFTNSIFKEERNAGEAKIKRFMSFETGFLTLLEKDAQTQLTVSLNGAIDVYRTEVRKAMQQARNEGRDPFEIVDPQQVADGVMLKFLPPAMAAMRSQTVRSGAFEALATDENMRGRSPEDVSKSLVEQLAAGRITNSELVTLRNIHTLTREFERLSGSQTGQAVGQSDREKVDAILKAQQE